MGMDIQAGEILFGDFLFRRVIAFQKTTGHSQAGFGSSGADVVEEGFVAVQRPARAVFADFAKEPVFDRVPFGSSRRVVADRQDQSEGIAQPNLEVVLPGAMATIVAAAGIGQKEEPIGGGIAVTSFVAPPMTQGIGGKAEVSWDRPMHRCPRLAMRS